MASKNNAEMNAVKIVVSKGRNIKSTKGDNSTIDTDGLTNVEVVKSAQRRH